jgi:hypothetical protein
MPIKLDDYQLEAINRLKNGSILCGGVGSGKSRTALAYFYSVECKGSLISTKIKPKVKDLYIITTARKRDTLEWEAECLPFIFDYYGIKVFVDSWNNIGKYTNVMNAFFIFDEQRVVGSGAWVKAFLRISKVNRWILLSATPGDNWQDYIPVFIANGFYKNRTEFTREHVVYSRFSKFPKVQRYLNTKRLEHYKDEILVDMDYIRPTVHHDEKILVGYNKELYKTVFKNRWDIYKNEPIQDVAGLGYILRRVVNSDPSRINAVKNLIETLPKAIVFYNFDYELDILRSIGKELGKETAEWNGHKHMPIPKSSDWLYLVQYTAGAEGWNCIETNSIIFYSQSYSYKTMVQAAGRIDRRNTPFKDLYFYHVKSSAPIDLAISRALSNKKEFNNKRFFKNVIFEKPKT